jgi:hypothetical protein
MAKDNPPNATSQDGTSWMSLFWAAIVVMLIYAGFAVVTFIRAGDGTLTDSVWSHTLWVVQGVEAVAFTAVGWLFGREVRRGEADAAKKQADAATENAGHAKENARSSEEKAEQARNAEKAWQERASSAELRGGRLAEAVRTAAALVPSQTGDASGLAESVAAPSASRVAGAPTAMAPLRNLADDLFPPG